MEVRRFFADTISPETGPLELDRPQSRHIMNVLRMKIGDEIELFDGRGSSAKAEITSLGKTNVRCRILERTVFLNEAGQPVAIAIGLIKDKRMKFALEKLSEVGVDEFYPVICGRSVVSLDSDEEKKEKVEKWRKNAVESAKQCKRITCMDVREINTFNRFVEHCEKFERKYYADMGSEDFLSASAAAGGGGSICLIGPEGGLLPAEKDYLTKKSFRPVKLGVNILRSETA
ncbi:MAG: RsmE family RNA methyltransferase, partial [bacterium]|nr:RsmE family RNA methyltransferase [bacterium]